MRRYGYTAGWSESDDGLYVFGGQDWSTYSHLNDFWFYSRQDNTWQEVIWWGFPSVRREAAIVTNNETNELYIFGGALQNGTHLNDLYVYRNCGSTCETSLTATTSMTSTSTSQTSTTLSNTSTSATLTTTTITSTKTSSSTTASETSTSKSETSSTTTVSWTWTSTSKSQTATTVTSTSTSQTSSTTFSGTSTSKSQTATTVTSTSTSQTLSSSTTWTQFSPRNFSQDVSVGEVVDELDRGAQWLASQLSDSNEGQVLETSLGNMTAMALVNATSAGTYSLFLPDLEAGAAFPPEVLGGDQVLVLTAFNEEVTGSLGVPEENGQPLASVGLPAVDVSIMRTRTGRTWEKASIRTESPIFVQLSKNATPGPSWVCAFQEATGNGTWSTEGLHMATPEELRASFGVEVPGVKQSAGCGYCPKKVWRRSKTSRSLVYRPQASSSWSCVCGFSSSLALHKTGSTGGQDFGLWRDQFLLLEVLPVTKRSNSKRAAESEQADRSTVNDANSKLQSIQEKIRTKRSLSKMQERVLVQNTLREASLRHGLTISCIEQHIWGENGWVQGSPSLENSSVLKAMKADMVETLP
ncbi:Tip elongation aberrant protein 1 (Altered polarity protein 8) (Cell polarity protein tea1) [Durusdinium trenchii]|uniref:Tip elongation aberrant protein 1 (Altered polarity protein 8) (Cell polarity protein tea1) n=1 Tax=Durusdinium trenchii TaxID=1381693 RepID=A0ABP0JGJ4_9DINO